MNIVIPMAGMGKRLRPHTLTVPKPLIPIAGKPIVQRLVEDVMKVTAEKVENIGFITGRFGEEVEQRLIQIAESFGAQGHILYQDEPLGTAHAILCGAPLLEGKVVVGFSDTLFKADFQIDTNQEGTIWVKKVDNPSSFGVVQLDDNNLVTRFVEKPDTFVSDQAIIGIYYFKDGAFLRDELQYLIDNNIRTKGEFGLTDALDNMKNKGVKFTTEVVTEWLDCGNKQATVDTHQRYIGFIQDEELIHPKAQIRDSVIKPPVYIGPEAQITDSVIGPYVSIGAGTQVKSSIIKDSIIQNHTTINDANVSNSMLGNFVHLTGRSLDLSIGDYNQAEF